MAEEPNKSALELAAELAADKVDGDGTAKLSRNAKKKQKKKAKKAAAAEQDDVEEVEEIAEEEPPTASDSDKQQVKHQLKESLISDTQLPCFVDDAGFTWNEFVGSWVW
jgi:hypothetical protein